MPGKRDSTYRSGTWVLRRRGAQGVSALSNKSETRNPCAPSGRRTAGHSTTKPLTVIHSSPSAAQQACISLGRASRRILICSSAPISKRWRDQKIKPPALTPQSSTTACPPPLLLDSEASCWCWLCLAIGDRTNIWDHQSATEAANKGKQGAHRHKVNEESSRFART